MREEFGHRLKGSRALNQLATSCRLATNELGFESFLMLVRFPDAGDTPLQIVISGLPCEWDRIYDHYQWAAIDPFIARAMAVAVPFSSDEIDWRATPRTEAMRGALHLHGLDHIVTIPLRGPAAEIGVMNFYRRDALPTNAEQRNALLSLSQLYSHRIYGTLIDHVRVTVRSKAAEMAPLSSRERQVLSLAALGDRVKVIAWKLEITPRTVTYFLRRAAEKIGAETLREAICKAAMRGELQLAEYPSRLDLSTAFVREPMRFAEGFAIRARACQI